MKNSVKTKWSVNVISFSLLCLLTFTGLVNWLILPKGYAARRGFLSSARHFFVGIHEWTALLYIVIIAVHILLHSSYIRANLKKLNSNGAFGQDS